VVETEETWEAQGTPEDTEETVHIAEVQGRKHKNANNE
jgi:hypothetical protein